jgi:methylenetetrahydrofolate reductase (NADH)
VVNWTAITHHSLLTNHHSPLTIMHIQDIFQAHRTTFSFEFFPPKTDAAWEELFVTIADLQRLQPSFVSVTYGAGGSTRERTHDLVVRIHAETKLTAVSHLTCVCHSRDELAAILDRYAASGIENIMALGGDPPRNLLNYNRSNDAFQYAEGLVRFIRSHSKPPDRRGFGIGVAGFPEGHPTTPNRIKEMDYLKQKVDAGADYICTQLFFENRDFYDFRERCDLADIRVPIVAGIMPITSKSGMVRMAELALPPNNAATCWIIKCAASTFTRSINRTPPERFSRTWGCLIPVACNRRESFHLTENL